MSLLRSVAQIDTRVKFLVARASTATYTVKTGSTTKFVMSETEFDAATDVNAGAVSAGDVLKDMGKSVTLVDAEGQHIATMRAVQLQNGVNSEGVDGGWESIPVTYVSTWTSDSTGAGALYPVTVTRIG
jgi:hypothetical protein